MTIELEKSDEVLMLSMFYRFEAWKDEKQKLEEQVKEKDAEIERYKVLLGEKMPDEEKSCFNCRWFNPKDEYCEEPEFAKSGLIHCVSLARWQPRELKQTIGEKMPEEAK